MNILNPFMAQMDMNQLKKRIEFSSFHIVKYSSIEFLSKFPNLEYILNEGIHVVNHEINNHYFFLEYHLVLLSK